MINATGTNQSEHNVCDYQWTAGKFTVVFKINGQYIVFIISMDPQIRHGILTHQVVMVDGILDEILPLIPARQRCEIFSAIRMDLSRVTSVLNSKQWDGSVPVVVFVG